MLVGGGHAHVEVIRRFMIRPPAAARVTLVAREALSPYSGMLPGHLAGEHSFERLHIDLYRLCQRAGVRLIQAEVSQLDLQAQQLEFEARPGLGFDALSINTGAVPTALAADPRVLPVKPIGQFLPRWAQLRETLPSDAELLLLGLGAGAIELALALRQQLPQTVRLQLVGGRLLPGWPSAAGSWARQQLTAAGIRWQEGVRVDSFVNNRLRTSDGQTIAASAVLDVTGVQAPPWIRRCGLGLDADGFIEVDQTLRSRTHPQVFAAGDIASLLGQPRPKSGVYAVRAGPVLAHNLRSLWGTNRLKRYRAQRTALALLSNGAGEVLACRGRLSLRGRWLQPVKHWIDRRFVERYNGQELTTAARAQRYVQAQQAAPAAAPQGLNAAVADDLPPAMRCQGCGGKLGAGLLKRSLGRLAASASSLQQPALLAGIGDDAAVLQVDREQLVLSTDTMTAFLSDPYLFAQFATHHAVNDVLAMGGELTTALATMQVESAGDALMERDLTQLLQGTAETLARYGASLAGGHSLAGSELTFGLTVIGRAPQTPLLKGGLLPGQRLLITKPLGSGVLLAGAMRSLCDARELESLFAMMTVSNQAAVPVLRAHQVSALTDLTGFGLLGHLAEMLRAAAVGVSLDLTAVPLLPGAYVLAEAGIGSSLLAANQGLLPEFLGAVDPVLRDLACDPQTAGGLLASVPADQAESCVKSLRDAGFADAALVGRVLASDEGWRFSA